LRRYDLTWRGQRADARTNNDCDAAGLPGYGFDLTRVNSSAHSNAKRPNILHDGRRTPDGGRWTIECHEEPVAGRIHLKTTEFNKPIANQQMVPFH
jgi:hypothetical protein